MAGLETKKSWEMFVRHRDGMNACIFTRAYVGYHSFHFDETSHMQRTTTISSFHFFVSYDTASEGW